MAEKKVVISIFGDEAAADAAVVSLKDAGVALEDAIGVLVLDENGKVKTHKVGSHSFYKGAGIGLVLGLLGPVGVGIGVGVADLVGLGPGVGVGVRVASDAGPGSEGGEGCANGHDITMMAIAATPIHCRAIRGPRTGAA